MTQTQIDAVIERWNQITGMQLRKGSKGTSDAIRSCLKRIAPEHGGTKAAAVHLLACVEWKWAREKNGEGAKWIKPTTVCRPANLARIEEDMALPANGKGAPQAWNPRL